MNILTISGGGVRGLIPLYVLREIEEKYEKSISSIFDYYAGSSIGTIIISALLITEDGINPKHKCEDLYIMIKTLCKKIFSNSIYHRIKTGYGLIGSKYPAENLEEILNDFFGDKKLKDLLKPVCFPTFDGISQKPIYFTRETHGELYLRDILRATTAAPTYFDPKQMIVEGIQFNSGEFEYITSRRMLYDSGIVVNNPALVAELHATRNMQIINKTKIFELCLGTGNSKVPEPTNNGMWGWMNSIIGYLFNGFNENEMYLLHLALNKENILYINVEIDKKYDQLDNVSDESLNHLTNRIEEWIRNNEEKFYMFVNKLITNKNVDKKMKKLLIKSKEKEINTLK